MFNVDVPTSNELSFVKVGGHSERNVSLILSVCKTYHQLGSKTIATISCACVIILALLLC